MKPVSPQSSPARVRRQAALLSFLRWASVLVLIFLLTALGYYLYVDVINRPPAEIYVATRGTAVSAVYGTVTINPVNQLTLVSQNAGYLITPPDLADKITALGIAVKKDQLLGTIVDEIGQRQLTQARSDYDAAVARQKNGPPTLGVLKSAQDQLDAIKRLQNNNVPRVQREAAENDVARLTAGVNNEKLELQHLVDAASSALKAAQDQQSRTEMRSPFDGILTAVNFGYKAYVLPNQAVFTIADAQTYVTGQVNEEDVGLLKVGMKADLRLYAYGNVTFAASVTQILPSPEVGSSRYTVNLNLDKPPTDIKYGLTGEMNIILGRKENALIIPARALNVDQVLIVEDGVVEQRTVKTGFKSLEFAEISDGVSEGDSVIVSDQDAFQPGERVRAVKTNQAKARK